MSAIDCVAVRQEDNSLKFSPLFIRFDKKAKETATVEVFVNGIPATNESNYRLIVKRGEKYATLELVDENERVLPESTGEDAVVAEEIAAMQSMLIPSNFISGITLDREQNELSFAMEGQIVYCSLFVWNYNTRIVVSDVDGTITKSDFTGPFAIYLGVDYYRPNIAELYTNIYNAGYRILYLTRKPMSYMDFVKGFIRKIKQNEYSMPPGPVISTPYSNYGVLAYKIWKGPTAFKKAILSCITDLFPENPLAAGIGDKEADIESYLYAGISPERCFMLDDKGNVCITATSESFVGYAGVGKQIKILFPEIQATEAPTTTKEITDVSSQTRIAES